MVESRTKYGLNDLIFLCMDATNLGFKSGFLDIICSFQVIEHISPDKLKAFLLEIYRVLKFNGEFYVSTPNIEVNKKGKFDYTMNPAHYQEFTVKEMKNLLSSIFPKVDMFGLRLTLKHSIFQRLKKIGIDKALPSCFNPVRAFFNQVTTDDFVISPRDLNNSVDIICRCRKS